MSSLKKLAIQGAMLTIIAYGASNIIRLGSNLILTRLLTPDLFGLMGLVLTFITALHLFSDIGVGPNIIQNKHGDDPVFLNTAWNLQVIRSICIWIGCLIITWPIASFYHEPRFLWLIPIVSFSTVISGFNSTAAHTLNRHLQVGKLVLIQLSTQIISTTAIIVCAWLKPTIWALVIGAFVSSLLELVWSYRIIPRLSHSFTWNKAVLQEIFSYGRWIFLSTMVTFFAEQSDRLVLGKVFSMEVLGVYTIALTFADLPRQITIAVSDKVIFPVLSRLTDLPRNMLRAKLLKNRFPILVILAFTVTLFACFGDILIFTLYDDRYNSAAWMLPILALGIWPEVLNNTNGPALYALGKPQYATVASFSRVLWTTSGIMVGYSLAGIVGAVVAIALNDIANYGLVNYGLWREGLSGIGQDIQATLLLAIMIFLVLSIRLGLGYGLPIDQLIH